MSKKRSGGFERMNGESSEETDLNIEDYDEKSGKKRRYLVNEDDSDEPLCKVKLSKREIICIVIGLIIITIAITIFAILAVVLSSKNSPNASAQESSSSVRLPSTLKPQLYQVTLQTNMDTFAVNGTTLIDIYVQSSTDTITLHTKDMTINAVAVTQNGSPLSISSTYHYTPHDFFIIKLGSTLSPSTVVQVAMSFNYTLRGDLVGFYKSYYKLEGSDTRHYLATTQFEPTDARKAFPCFDEPALKANFSITLIYPQGYSAASNMPIKRNSTQGSLKVTSFETSYKMSTYLVAFVISDFDCSNPSIVNNHIKVRVCARSDVFSSTAYSQKVADIVIGYYERFFGVDYPLPKQDLFAIPDFAAGAMENWGLITYRETALLYNETLNPVVSKQRVAVVVAHELAHQWFGNLVTMEWWDGLWLNEGFASYVEYIGTAEAEPSWMMLEQFFVDTVQTAFDADGLNWSHPIIQQVHNPDEINGLFDSISYDKGASLIQMLRQFIGNTSFTEGLKHYLKSHRFGNAETHELWEALNNVSSHGVSVTSMMDTWTKQMGYPVVTVTSNGQQATVTQERFLQNPLPLGGQMASSEYNYVWIIPFNYITENGGSSSKLITAAQDTINWDASKNGFIKVNVNQTGFYRVNYDQQNWERIINHLMIDPQSRPKVLRAVDRAGLLEDAFALSSAGQLNVTVALNMSRYLKTESAYVPWKTGIRWFFILGRRLSLTSIYGKYKGYVLSLLSNITKQVNFNATNLDHLHQRLQPSILSTSYHFGNKEIGDTSLRLFREWMNGGSSIAPNLRSAVYSIAIATGGREEWEFLWKWYQTTNNPYEKKLCLYALSDSTEPWILNRYLELSLTDSVRSQDTLTVIESVSGNIHGRYLAWNFFRNNYDTFFKKYGGGSFSFSRVIRTLTRSFSTEWELSEVISFFSQRDAGSGALAVSQSVEVISGNIKWVNTNLKVIEAWLDENNNNSTSI